jgi:hypothetical protein
MMRRKTRKQRGGESNAYSFGQAVAPGAPYASEVVRMSACQAVHRPGEIMGYSPPGRGGLPGMGGGGRKYKKFTLKQLKRLQKKKRGTRGGGWTVNTSAPLGGPNVLLDNTKIRPCTWGGGGKRRRNRKHRGGGSLLGSPDLAAYAAPTAGYSNTPSSWLSSTGSPVMIQPPYEARTMNPACIKTGGGKKSSRRSKSKNWWKFW